MLSWNQAMFPLNNKHVNEKTYHLLIVQTKNKTLNLQFCHQVFCYFVICPLIGKCVISLSTLSFSSEDMMGKKRMRE